MKLLRVLGILTALLAGAPAVSYAQVAYTAKDVNLRVGPGVDYPAIAILPPGLEIFVHGCLSDYRWCDIEAGPDRGWVYSGNIVYPYRGARVPVLNYGAAIGLGILAFTLSDYWDRHYSGRPWYSQRQAWINRPGREFGPGDRRPPPHGPFGRPDDRRPPPQRPFGRPDDRRPPPQGPFARPDDRRPPPQGPFVRPDDRRPPSQGPGGRPGQRRPQDQE